MGVFEAINTTSEKAIDSGEQYLSATRSYYKLKTFKYFTKSLSSIILTVLVGCVMGTALILLLIAATIWLSSLFSSIILACLTMSGVLFLLALIIFICRKAIDRWVITKIGEDYFNL